MQGSKSGRLTDDFCVWDLVFVISMGRGRGSQSGVEYLECLVPSVGIRQSVEIEKKEKLLSVVHYIAHGSYDFL